MRARVYACTLFLCLFGTRTEFERKRNSVWCVRGSHGFAIDARYAHHDTDANNRLDDEIFFVHAMEFAGDAGKRTMYHPNLMPGTKLCFFGSDELCALVVGVAKDTKFGHLALADFAKIIAIYTTKYIYRNGAFCQDISQFGLRTIFLQKKEIMDYRNEQTLDFTIALQTLYITHGYKKILSLRGKVVAHLQLLTVERAHSIPNGRGLLSYFGGFLYHWMNKKEDLKRLLSLKTGYYTLPSWKNKHFSRSNENNHKDIACLYLPRRLNPKRVRSVAI